MKKFLEEFKSFAMRGNVVDLAIGVVIGGAFGKIVTSLVNDIIMPPIGKLLGGVDFTNLFITFGDETYDTLAAAQEAGVATWNYGLFINTILDFIIVAFAIFILITQMNKLKKKQEEEQAPPKISKQEELLIEIRDLLKQKTT